MALQVVTVGEQASEHFDKLQGADNYSEAYFFHGLAVQSAEATANYVNRVDRQPGDGHSRKGVANAIAGATPPART